MNIGIDDNLIGLLMSLLPGFITFRIVSSYNQTSYLKRETTPLQYVSIILLFGVLAVVIVGILSFILGLVMEVVPSGYIALIENLLNPIVGTASSQIPKTIWDALPLYLAAILVGVLYGNTFSWWQRLFSTGLDAASPWAHLFTVKPEEYTYVVVVMEGGVTVGGWLSRSSEDSDIAEIVLEDPTIFSDESTLAVVLPIAMKTNHLDQKKGRLLILSSSNIKMVYTAQKLKEKEPITC